MKVRVVNVGHGRWTWQIVAGNGAVVGEAMSQGPRNRTLLQAEQVSGPLGLVVEE